MKVERLPEPELRFKGGTATYCKSGLEDTGPYDAIKESHKGTISIGIIGMKEQAEKTKEWVGLCNDFIESRPHKEKEEIRKELFPDFPGCGVAFDTKLVAEDRFIQYIPIADYARLDLYNDIKYTEGLLSLFEDKIKLMLDVSGDAKPDVILCPLSDEMYERGHVAGDYHRKLKKKKEVDPNQLNLFKDLDGFSNTDFAKEEEEAFHINFRSIMKKMAMSSSIRIPIQLLRQPTIDPYDKTTQNAATKAWNFCTGIYYKSGKHPWILDDIDPKTCYLGISFFHKKGHYQDDIYTSMAHMFANDFEDIILRGKKVDFDEALGAPFLDYEKSKGLLAYALDVFEKLRQAKPQRLVVHKTSEFRDDETKGFSEVLEDAGILYDLITLKKSQLRLVRYGTMPVPRGSMFSVDNDINFLYTKGYIPELKTYPGVHVPAPFEIIRARGDSSYKEICKEILALTKLNWNTADFCCGLPITIGFSRNVGQVLKVFDDKDSEEPEKSYRFYM
jgi:hypothetical protein